MDREVQQIMYDINWMSWVVKRRVTRQEIDAAYMRNEFWDWFQMEYESANYTSDTDIPWFPEVAQLYEMVNSDATHDEA